MTVVIRYRTQYLVNDRDSLFFSFAPSNDVSLHCVIGLPLLLSLGGLIDLVKGMYVCSELNRTFPLTLDPSDKESSDGVVFDNITSTIPVRVSANVRPIPSILR